MLNCRKIYLIFLALVSLNLGAQNRWEHFTINDGLPSNKINDIHIIDSNNIWVATNAGVSFFNGSTFTNYNTTNSSLASNNITKIEYTFGDIWFSSNSGLSRFDGRNINTFNTTNGLIGNSIRDMTVDTNGILWLACNNGVTRYNGTQFMHDSGKVAQSIAVDSNNLVYILKYTAIFNISGFTVYEIYDGVQWKTYPINFSNATSGVKIKKTKSNNLILYLSNSKAYFEIIFPFDLNPVFPAGKSSTLNGFNNIEIDTDGKKWLSSLNNSQNLFSGLDSNLTPFSFSPANSKFSVIELNSDLIAVGHENGFFIATDSIKPQQTELALGINNLESYVNSQGTIFSKNGGANSGLIYPKGDFTSVIDAANVVFIVKDTSGNFDAFPKRPEDLTMTPGPIGVIPNTEYGYISRVNKIEVNQHLSNYTLPNYVVPKNIADWPVIIKNQQSIGAPFLDANQNFIYDPQNGDVPIILGEESIYWINHPENSNFQFEFHGVLYGYNGPLNDPINDVVFLKYKIINKTQQNQDSMKLGFFVNSAIGNPLDDYAASDSLNNIMYTYNGNAIDNTANSIVGYGASSPALGIKFLSDTLDSFVINPSSSANNQYWVNGIKGITPLGSPYVYPGSTNNSKYMFTGSPYNNIGWTEKNSGNNPGNRSLLGTVPYFCMAPNDEKVLDLAIGLYRDFSNTKVASNTFSMINALNQMKPIFDTINFTAYNWGQNNNCHLITSLEKNESKRIFKLFPNPAQNELFIESENEIQEISLFNIRGTLVFRNRILNERQVRIHLNSELSNGIYFVRISANGETMNRKVVVQR